MYTFSVYCAQEIKQTMDILMCQFVFDWPIDSTIFLCLVCKNNCFMSFCLFWLCVAGYCGAKCATSAVHTEMCVPLGVAYTCAKGNATGRRRVGYGVIQTCKMNVGKQEESFMLIIFVFRKFNLNLFVLLFAVLCLARTN